MIEQIDYKNQVFKDIYSQYEECIGKFHSVFVAYHTYKEKTNKYEETFQ